MPADLALKHPPISRTFPSSPSVTPPQAGPGLPSAPPRLWCPFAYPGGVTPPLAPPRPVGAFGHHRAVRVLVRVAARAGPELPVRHFVQPLLLGCVPDRKPLRTFGLTPSRSLPPAACASHRRIKDGGSGRGVDDVEAKRARASVRTRTILFARRIRRSCLCAASCRTLEGVYPLKLPPEPPGPSRRLRPRL